MDAAGEDAGMKGAQWEERTDWVQQALRTVCLQREQSSTLNLKVNADRDRRGGSILYCTNCSCDLRHASSIPITPAIYRSTITDRLIRDGLGCWTIVVIV